MRDAVVDDYVMSVHQISLLKLKQGKFGGVFQVPSNNACQLQEIIAEIAMVMCLSNISGSGSLGLLLHHVSCYCHVSSIAYVVTSPVSFQLLSLNTTCMFIGGPDEGR